MSQSGKGQEPFHSEILIIGAGIFGTSTAYHLSKTLPNPSSVTVIDRTPYPPAHAASTDINKIIRADYTSRFYMDLGFEAIEAWNSWPEFKRNGLYHRTGWINLSKKGSDISERIRKNFRDRGDDPTEDVPLEVLRSKFGGIFKHTDFEDIENAYWNPLAGWCDAGAATAELMKVAVENGVHYVVGEVEQLLHNDVLLKGVMTSNGQIFTANKILLATGAWTGKIMTSIEDALDIPEEDRITMQFIAAGVCVAHYKMTAEEMKQLRDMPVVIYGTGGDEQPPPSNRLLKFTNANSFTNTIRTQSGHLITAPPDQDQHVVSERLKKETWNVILSKVMPQYTNRPVEYWRLCWDAITPSQDHLISKHPHPQLGNLFLAIGGSFHSYKFLPIAGKYVSNALNNKSNGAEKDERWAWKRGIVVGRGAHEKALPRRELSHLNDDEGV